MSLENKEEVFDSARQAAREESDLQERVRTLVVNALVHRRVDPQASKDVMRDTVAGLDAGLADHAGQAGNALEAAVKGLDEALGKAVHAFQMAMEESWGEGRRFAETDLRDTYDAVKDLEDDLVATLKQTGEKAQGILKEDFSRLGEHLSRASADTGVQLRETMSALSRSLSHRTGDAARSVGVTTQEAGERMSAVASGFLRGLADALDHHRRGGDRGASPG